MTSRPPLVPMISARRSESKATSPFATSPPSGPTTSTASPALKLPSTARTPAASRLLLPCETARRAPSSTTMRPRAAGAQAIHSFRAAFRGRLAGKYVPTSRPCQTSTRAPGRSPKAMTTATPERLAMRAASGLEAIPPEPSAERPRAAEEQVRRDLLDGAEQARPRRVGMRREYPLDVGQQHQEVRPDDVGHQ